MDLCLRYHFVQAIWRICDCIEARAAPPWSHWAFHLATVIDAQLAYSHLSLGQQLDASNTLSYSRSQLPTISQAVAVAYRDVLGCARLWRWLRTFIQICSLMGVLWNVGLILPGLLTLRDHELTPQVPLSSLCANIPRLAAPPSPSTLWLAQASSDYALSWLPQHCPRPLFGELHFRPRNPSLAQPYRAATNAETSIAELLRATTTIMDRHFDSLVGVEAHCNYYLDEELRWWPLWRRDSTKSFVKTIRSIKTFISWVNDMPLLLDFAMQADVSAAALIAVWESVRDAVEEADRLSSLQQDLYGHPCASPEECRKEWMRVFNHLRAISDWADLTDLNTYIIRQRISALLFFARWQIQAGGIVQLSDTILKSSGMRKTAYAALDRLCSDLVVKDRLYSVSRRAGSYAGVQWAYRKNDTYNTHWESCASSAGNFSSEWWQPRSHTLPKIRAPGPSLFSRFRHWKSFIIAKQSWMSKTQDKTYSDLPRPFLRHPLKQLNSSVMHQSCISAHDVFSVDLPSQNILDLEEVWREDDDHREMLAVANSISNATARAMILERGRDLLGRGVWCLEDSGDDLQRDKQQQHDEALRTGRENPAASPIDTDEYILSRIHDVRFETDRVGEERHKAAWEEN